MFPRKKSGHRGAGSERSYMNLVIKLQCKKIQNITTFVTFQCGRESSLRGVIYDQIDEKKYIPHGAWTLLLHLVHFSDVGSHEVRVMQKPSS